MSNKKLHRLTLLIAVVLLIVTLTACGISTGMGTPSNAPNDEDAMTSTAPPETTDEPSATSPTETSEATTENRIVLESDAFPDFWIGKWVCTKSEQMAIEEGETVEFLDYKNKISITGTDGNINYKWIYYNADTNLFLYYNKDEFVEDEYLFDFEVVKQTETQIILNRVGFGSEVILEKT